MKLDEISSFKLTMGSLETSLNFFFKNVWNFQNLILEKRSNSDLTPKTFTCTWFFLLVNFFTTKIRVHFSNAYSKANIEKQLVKNPDVSLAKCR